MDEHHSLRLIRRAFAASVVIHVLVIGSIVTRALDRVPAPPPPPPMLAEIKPSHPVQQVPKVPPVPTPQPVATVIPNPARSTARSPRPQQIVAHEPATDSAMPVAPPSAPTVGTAASPQPQVTTVVASAGPVMRPGFDAAYLRNPPPVYPAAARRRGQQGTTTLLVRVARDGHPQSVAVAVSSGHQELDDAALAAVRGWTFVPARRGEEMIEGEVEVPIRFRIDR